MLRQRRVPMRQQRMFEDPPFARQLFGNTYFSWIWLIARLYVGWQWLTSGWGKFNDPKWMETGAALQAFWERAIVVPETGRPPVVFDWYRSFLEVLLAGGHYTWFAKLVLLGEIAVGLALILGAFTGIAAFFGALMNWNFMMAGSASTNPVMFALAVLLLLAWKTAGYYGLDRWLLPALGTPWQPGEIFQRTETPRGSQPPLPAHQT
ncbi:MAG: DoxX family protein [Chloroflexi bacterium]|nr:DoxX family protein [Chloroflexota bacterium]